MMWVAIAATLIVAVGVIAVRARRPPDLGAVSTGWITQHRDNPQ
jgi:hypothetical protein